MFYAGLGNEYISFTKPFSELMVSAILYGLFLYIAFTGLKLEVKDTAMITVLVLTVQVLCAFYFPGAHGYSGWLIFGFVVGRFIGVPHPGSEIEEPLDSKRIMLGWLSLIIFILCFSPNPLQ
jgi:hypothetical protein